MDHQRQFVRPVVLVEGSGYLMLETSGREQNEILRPVVLTAYDPCPAFVIVRTEYGQKQRCPREAIFSTNPISSNPQ